MARGPSQARVLSVLVIVACLALTLVAVLGRARGGPGASRSSSRAPAEPTRPSADLERLPVAPPSPVLVARDALEPETSGGAEARNPRTMRVTVRDATDERLLAGAWVTVFDRATPTRVRTEDDGSCRVPLLSLDERVSLLVEAAEHFRSRQEVLPCTSVTIELARCVTLSGRVVAADTGAVVAAAIVELIPHDGTRGEPERCVSGSDGAYSILAPLYVVGLLEVRAEGFATTRQRFELRSEERNVVQDILLPRGLELAGRVEDRDSGRGIPGARVGDLVADEEGRFRGRVPAHPVSGRTTLDVRSPGYATLSAHLPGVPADEPVFRLPRLAHLEGRVDDGNGKPIASAKVTFRASGPDPRAEPPQSSPLYALPEGWAFGIDDGVAFSDADGRYRLAVLPWSLNGEASASARGFAQRSALLPLLGDPGSSWRLDWTLEPDPGGVAVLLGTVELDGQPLGLPGRVTWSGSGGSGEQRLERGAFRLGVEPGTVRLSATLDVLPGTPAEEISIRVGPGEVQALDLDVVPPRATIQGTVRLASGAPVAGHEVEARCSLPRGGSWPLEISHRARTDVDGRYELHVVDLGLDHDVRTATLAGDVLECPGMAPGSRDVDFRLPTGFRLFLRARESGTGALLLPGQDVRFLVRGDELRGFRPLDFVSRNADVEGWYESWLPEREVDLLAWPSSTLLPLHAAERRSHVALDGPAPPRLELLLERGVDLTVILAAGVDPWPTDHGLLLLDEELWSVVRGPLERWTPEFEADVRAAGRVVFYGSGRAHLRGIAPGSYRFKVLPGDLLVEPERVRIERETLSVPVRWSRAR